METTRLSRAVFPESQKVKRYHRKDRGIHHIGLRRTGYAAIVTGGYGHRVLALELSNVLSRIQNSTRRQSVKRQSAGNQL